jgi:hypothetical protein
MPAFADSFGPVQVDMHELCRYMKVFSKEIRKWNKHNMHFTIYQIFSYLKARHIII